MTRVMPLMFRLGLLPKPPIASTVATLDDRASEVIRPAVEPQISSAGREQPAGQTLATLTKSTVDVAVRVDVVEPGGVERSTGKMRRILDQRHNA